MIRNPHLVNAVIGCLIALTHYLPPCAIMETGGMSDELVLFDGDRKRTNVACLESNETRSSRRQWSDSDARDEPDAADDEADSESAETMDEESVTAESVARIKTDSDLRKLRSDIRRCRRIYFTKHVNTEILSPWSIMHGLIAYGSETQITARGRTVNALDYLCSNGPGRDLQLLELQGSRLKTQNGPGVQGHDGQLLAMLAQSNIPGDYPLKVSGRRFSVKDLVEFEMRGCRQKTELTFKLISLSHYLRSAEKWTSDIGETWSIPRLINEELKQPINGAACGGTHRLMALSYAVKIRRERGEPIDGEWKRAADFVDAYQEYAIRLQNSDGSFSTNWFESPEAKLDRKQRLYTTGHILEWLAFSLPDDKLTDPRVVAAVEYLLELMLNTPNHELEVGPRGHAIRALKLYEFRVFGEVTSVDDLVVARASRRTVLNSNMDSTRGRSRRNGLFRRR